MFADTKAFSAFAVDDLAQASKFYGETLGIRVSEHHGLLTLNWQAVTTSGYTRSRTTPRPPTPSSCCSAKVAPLANACWTWHAFLSSGRTAITSVTANMPANATA